MIHIVLVEPEIPPNTGNIARLCAATGCVLHLIKPLGFSLDDKYLRRAGMDYWEHVDRRLWENWDAFNEACLLPEARFHLLTTKATQFHWDASFADGDYLIFGRETRGLPEALLHAHPEKCLRIPMPGPFPRSLNLGTSVGIVAYEALRQISKGA